MKRTSIFIAALLVVAACNPLNRNTQKEREPVLVTVQEVKHESVTAVNSYAGNVRTTRTTTLNAPAQGTLVSLSVKRGERVRAGQELARIESQNVMSTYRMAEATLRQAQDGYDRASRVYDSGSITEQQMVEINSKLEQAKAAMDAAQKALDDCTISAPFDAYVEEVMATEGVKTGIFDPLMRLMDISEVEIKFAVPESEINGLKEGQAVTISIPAIGGEQIDGKISSKGISASPLSHSYECVAVPDRRNASMMPGMVCTVLIRDEGSSGYVMPANCIQTGNDGRYLWTVKDGIVHKTAVAVEGFSGTGVLISSGLSAGDLVITEGFQKVSSGMKVKTRNENERGQ